MGPYGSIWLDTAAKMIVRTLRIFFVFKKSLKIGLGVQKRGPWLKHIDLFFQKSETSKFQDPSIQDELILS